MPATMVFGVHFLADFKALIAPIAISSLFETIASNFMPVLSQFIVMSWPSVRLHLPSRLSTIFMPAHALVAITSSMSLVRARADSLESSPISTRRPPLPPSSLHTCRACSVPESRSSDATTATPAGSLSKSTGLRFT